MISRWTSLSILALCAALAGGCNEAGPNEEELQAQSRGVADDTRDLFPLCGPIGSACEIPGATRTCCLNAYGKGEVPQRCTANAAGALVWTEAGETKHPAGKRCAWSKTWPILEACPPKYRRAEQFVSCSAAEAALGPKTCCSAHGVRHEAVCSDRGRGLEWTLDVGQPQSCRTE
jgi:hypothetical protein